MFAIAWRTGLASSPGRLRRRVQGLAVDITPLRKFREYRLLWSGLFVSQVGHGRTELAEAARRQMEQLEYYASFWDFSNTPSIELAERLVTLAPPGIERVFYTNGGSEGTESALKLARLAWHTQGKPERSVVLTRSMAYHGVRVNDPSLVAAGQVAHVALLTVFTAVYSPIDSGPSSYP